MIRLTDDTFVYFARPVGTEGPVKIGCSTNPIQRLVSLMCWSPHKLEIAATVPGTSRLERQFHAKFRHLHSHHEWFAEDPELSATIAAVGAGTFDLASLPTEPRDPLGHYKGRTARSRRTQGLSVKLTHWTYRSDLPWPADLTTERLENLGDAEFEQAAAQIDAYCEQMKADVRANGHKHHRQKAA